MAVPKRKMSRANTRTRRSAWTAKLTQLDNVKVQGQEVAVPRRLVPDWPFDRRRLTRSIFATPGPGAGRYVFNYFISLFGQFFRVRSRMEAASWWT